MVECSSCGSNIELTNPEKGEIIECGDCGLELEVRETKPLKIAEAPKEEEDWGE